MVLIVYNLSSLLDGLALSATVRADRIVAMRLEQLYVDECHCPALPAILFEDG